MSLSVNNFELQQKLTIYESLLIKWSASLNLVAKSTIADIKNRHFEDSLQLVPFLSLKERIVDIGTGAGFPGMVLAMCGFNVTLVESDQKKCVFLENVSRETNTVVSIACSRIESYLPSFAEHFDVVCSRGLAPISRLIALSGPLIKKNSSRGLFLKGEDVDRELSELFLSQGRIRKTKSFTNSTSCIIEYQF